MQIIQRTHLILEHADGLSLIESKAAQTAASGLFNGIRRVCDILPQTQCHQAFVIYGGTAEQKRSDVTLIPWNNLHDRTWV